MVDAARLDRQVGAVEPDELNGNRAGGKAPGGKFAPEMAGSTACTRVTDDG